MRPGSSTYYERMRKSGLAEAYRRECDFMDWRTRAHARRDRSVVHRARPRADVLLWGDSFAQALSLGLRESLPARYGLAQVTTSACRRRSMTSISR